MARKVAPVSASLLAILSRLAEADAPALAPDSQEPTPAVAAPKNAPTAAEVNRPFAVIVPPVATVVAA